METKNTPYQKQIFVCTNDRHGESASCGDQNGEAVFKELRKIAKERGLHPRIRVAQAKCLGYCNQGVNIMTYPDNVWHSQVTLDDVPQLVQTYLSEKEASSG